MFPVSTNFKFQPFVRGVIDTIVDGDGNRIIIGMSFRDGLIQASFDKSQADAVRKAVNAAGLKQEWGIDKVYSGLIYNPSFRSVENDNG